MLADLNKIKTSHIDYADSLLSRSFIRSTDIKFLEDASTNREALLLKDKILNNKITESDLKNPQSNHLALLGYIHKNGEILTESQTVNFVIESICNKMLDGSTNTITYKDGEKKSEIDLIKFFPLLKGNFEDFYKAISTKEENSVKLFLFENCKFSNYKISDLAAIVNSFESNIEFLHSKVIAIPTPAFFECYLEAVQGKDRASKIIPMVGMASEMEVFNCVRNSSRPLALDINGSIKNIHHLKGDPLSCIIHDYLHSDEHGFLTKEEWQQGMEIAQFITQFLCDLNNTLLPEGEKAIKKFVAELLDNDLKLRTHFEKTPRKPFLELLSIYLSKERSLTPYKTLILGALTSNEMMP